MRASRSTTTSSISARAACSNSASRWTRTGRSRAFLSDDAKPGWECALELHLAPAPSLAPSQTSRRRRQVRRRSSRNKAVLKQTLKRTFTLFAASACITAILAGLLWWHHSRVAGGCNPFWSAGEPLACYYGTTFFGDWPSIAMLAFVYLAVCFFVALLRELAKRRSSR